MSFSCVKVLSMLYLSLAKSTFAELDTALLLVSLLFIIVGLLLWTFLQGTENIQSPEMLSLAKTLDKKRPEYDRRRNNGVDITSDVWSLGCTFYELLTGEYLFEVCLFEFLSVFLSFSFTSSHQGTMNLSNERKRWLDGTEISRPEIRKCVQERCRIQVWAMENMGKSMVRCNRDKKNIDLVQKKRKLNEWFSSSGNEEGAIT